MTIKSSKRTHSFPLRDVMFAQWARGAFSKVSYEEGPPTFPPPPPLSFYVPFLTEKVPLSYTFYWQMTPPLTDVDALFSADHEWIPKPGGIRASLAATKCICYLSLLIFRTLQYTSTGEIPTYSYLKPKQKKNTPFKRKPRDLPI